MTATLSPEASPGALRAPLPPLIEQTLQRLGTDPQTILLAVRSDINPLGHYAPQWLLATPQRLWVFDEQQPHEPLLDLSLETVDDVRTVSAIGSGMIQCRSQGIWVDLIRYSNRLKYPFSRLAKRLEQLVEGEEVVLSEEDSRDPRRCERCGLMLEFAGETCPRCVNKGAAVVRVLALMKPYWQSAALMMALLLGGIAIDMSTPLLTRYLVDNVLNVGQAASPDFTLPLIGRVTERSQVLLLVVGILATIQVVRVVISVSNGRLSSRVGTSITYDMRGRMVDHLEKLSLSYYDKQQTGSLVGRVAYDTEAVQGFIAQLTSGFFMQMLMVAFSIVMMFSLEPRLAVWTLLPAPFVLGSTYVFYRVVYPTYRRFWDRSSRQAGLLNGMLSGIRVVKAFAQEDREFQRYDRSSQQLRDSRRQVDTAAATFYPSVALLFQAGGWIVWYVGGRNVLDGHISLGTLMAFFGYLGLFYGPLSNLANLTTWLTQVSTQMHRIFEVLDTPVSVPESANPTPLPQMQGKIEFERVTFGYSRQTPVLKGVSFEIEAGQMVGIVGSSGSGKTTIINLINRFYDIDEGTIHIDGVDIRRISKQDLRGQVGVVLQEPFLFRGTLWENLTYGRRDASVEEVIAASRSGNAHDFIMRQAHGYDTWVGERGAGLSGGERQRLSIARALLCDPKVLILDEATSSVDSESERLIQSALEEVVRGRTTIAIAHRLSTLRNCHRIIVIEDGRIRESGSHAELMALNGKYAKLVRLQSDAPSDVSDADRLKALEKLKAEEAQQRSSQHADPDTGLHPLGTFHPRWLDPRIARVHLGNHGALHVTILNEGIYHGAFALRVMPVRFPDRYISLRYLNSEKREEEIGLIRDLNDWPEEARKLIHESLLKRYFVHTVLRIESIRQIQNYLEWKVETDLGPAEFIMRFSTDAAQDYGGTGKMLLDVEDNRYLIPDVSELPHSDQVIYQRYIYW